MSEWYYAVDGVQQGPVAIADLRRFVAEKRLALDDFAWQPSMPEWRPLKEILEVTGRAPLFSVGLVKLVVMTIGTFGFYEIYWMYRQWEEIQEHSGEEMRPFWRAIFAIFWFHALIRGVNDAGERHGVTSPVSETAMTAIFVIASVCSRLPDPFSLVGFLTLLPIAVVQERANEINAVAAPLADPNTRIRGWNWLAVLMGWPLFGLVIIELFWAE